MKKKSKKSYYQAFRGLCAHQGPGCRYATCVRNGIFLFSGSQRIEDRGGNILYYRLNNRGFYRSKGSVKTSRSMIGRNARPIFDKRPGISGLAESGIGSTALPGV